jgi:hypothetical protein
MYEPFEQTEGLINNFNGTTMVGGATVDGKISLGTFTFLEVSSVNDGTADFQLAVDFWNCGLILDGEAEMAKDFLNIAANQEGYFKATTSVVPIPAAVWLLGSGLLGLIGIRRRN